MVLSDIDRLLKVLPAKTEIEKQLDAKVAELK